MEFEEASEPTDIIWENRSITRWQKFQRYTVAFIVVCLLLSASFVIIFFCYREASIPVLKYPQSELICEGIRDDFDEK